MARCIKDKERRQKSSQTLKTFQTKQQRNVNKMNILRRQKQVKKVQNVQSLGISKRAGRRKRRRQKANQRLFHFQIGKSLTHHNTNPVNNYLSVHNRNEEAAVSQCSTTVVAPNKNVISSSDSVIVCDSDSENEENANVIEITDDTHFSDEDTQTKNNEIIVLDDSQSEGPKTPCKRTCLESKESEKEQGQSTTALPNSIVIVVSNSPSKAQETAEVIEIDDSFSEQETDNFSNNNTNNIKQLEPSRVNNQPNMPEKCDFIPFSEPLQIPNINCQTNKTSKSPENIKITICGHDRSFTQMVAPNSNTPMNYRRTKPFASTSATTTNFPVQMTNSVLPKNTVGSIFGANLYNAGEIKHQGLRDIIIDGSNVAMGHSLGRFFSVKGLKICIDYFIQRGHKVRAFVPHFRIKHGQSSEPALLQYLHAQGLVVLTPSREISGKTIACYDDRLLVQCAAELGAVVVSGDNYRDLLRENPNLRETIEKRLLMPTWVDDMIMFPSDPLGRFGPSLDRFLRFP